MQNEIDFVIRDSPENEAYARCLMNNIIVCAIGEEKRAAIATYDPPDQHTQSSSSSSSTPKKPAQKDNTHAQLFLRFETPLEYPVIYKQQKRTLRGIADYSLWYDDDTHDTTATNLIVMEAKRRGSASLGEGQMIAYMGKQ